MISYVYTAANIKIGNIEETINLQILDCGNTIKTSQKGITPIFNQI